MVSLQGVSKSYGRFTSLKNVTLTIEAGELCVLGGGCASGNVTALRIIAGLDALDSGELWINGRPHHDLRPAERDIAIVFSPNALVPHRTLFDNIADSLRLRRIPKPEIEQRVRQAADILDFVVPLSRKPRELAGGEWMRACLAKALVQQKPVLVFSDYHLELFEEYTRRDLRRLLRLVHQRMKLTIVYATHRGEEALALGQRIAFFQQGELAQFATPIELLERPANRNIAQFIHAGALNLLKGSLVRTGPDVHIRGEGFHLTLSATQVAKWAGRDEGEVLVGIRSDALYDRRAPVPVQERGVLSAVVEDIELTGSELNLSVRVGGQPIAVHLRRAPGVPIVRAQSIELVPDAEKVLLFDHDPSATTAL